MQLSKYDLIHNIVKIFKDYPDGVSFRSDPKIVFYSEETVSEKGVQLMEAALSKGLQLSSEQFLLILDKNKLVSLLGDKNNLKEYLLVVFGKSDLEFDWNLSAASADVIASDSQVKKVFWNSLKDAYLNFLNKD